ncbi:hypothetical protein HYH03_004108 [Edaphochlamys debaryana]|uniref:Uncharacterized protein n=1 Tax=Edaphochlamys debaryana TaxID=47281 RepID=A0A835YBM1_9CHLO|nr:hypothetical protein HYH03_004108 [Edaphochlamys debaryana]|eukprot:KAG2497841.1 hypothetical protein HYH03_004108 [Edaphochlamys debaryana]
MSLRSCFGGCFGGQSSPGTSAEEASHREPAGPGRCLLSFLGTRRSSHSRGTWESGSATEGGTRRGAKTDVVDAATAKFMELLCKQDDTCGALYDTDARSPEQDSMRSTVRTGSDYLPGPHSIGSAAAHQLLALSGASNSPNQPRRSASSLRRDIHLDILPEQYSQQPAPGAEGSVALPYSASRRGSNPQHGHGYGSQRPRPSAAGRSRSDRVSPSAQACLLPVPSVKYMARAQTALPSVQTGPASGSIPQAGAVTPCGSVSDLRNATAGGTGSAASSMTQITDGMATATNSDTAQQTQVPAQGKQRALVRAGLGPGVTGAGGTIIGAVRTRSRLYAEVAASGAGVGAGGVSSGGGGAVSFPMSSSMGGAGAEEAAAAASNCISTQLTGPDAVTGYRRQCIYFTREGDVNVVGLPPSCLSAGRAPRASFAALRDTGLDSQPASAGTGSPAFSAGAGRPPLAPSQAPSPLPATPSHGLAGSAVQPPLPSGVFVGGRSHDSATWPASPHEADYALRQEDIRFPAEGDAAPVVSRTISQGHASHRLSGVSGALAAAAGSEEGLTPEQAVARARSRTSNSSRATPSFSRLSAGASSAAIADPSQHPLARCPEQSDEVGPLPTRASVLSPVAGARAPLISPVVGSSSLLATEARDVSSALNRLQEACMTAVAFADQRSTRLSRRVSTDTFSTLVGGSLGRGHPGVLSRTQAGTTPTAPGAGGGSVPAFSARSLAPFMDAGGSVHMPAGAQLGPSGALFRVQSAAAMLAPRGEPSPGVPHPVAVGAGQGQPVVSAGNNGYLATIVDGQQASWAANRVSVGPPSTPIGALVVDGDLFETYQDASTGGVDTEAAVVAAAAYAAAAASVVPVECLDTRVMRSQSVLAAEAARSVAGPSTAEGPFTGAGAEEAEEEYRTNMLNVLLRGDFLHDTQEEVAMHGSEDDDEDVPEFRYGGFELGGVSNCSFKRQASFLEAVRRTQQSTQFNAQIEHRTSALPAETATAELGGPSRA